MDNLLLHFVIESSRIVYAFQAFNKQCSDELMKSICSWTDFPNQPLSRVKAVCLGLETQWGSHNPQALLLISPFPYIAVQFWILLWWTFTLFPVSQVSTLFLSFRLNFYRLYWEPLALFWAKWSLLWKWRKCGHGLVLCQIWLCIISPGEIHDASV